MAILHGFPRCRQVCNAVKFALWQVAGQGDGRRTAMPADNVPARRSLTVRLTPPQLKRIKAFAVEVELTVQDLLVAGLNCVFAQHSLDPIDPEVRLLPPPKTRRPKGSA